MIGIIVTGHGEFASGLKSALSVIAGEQEKICFVDFLVNHSSDDLSNNLNAAFKELSDAEGILVLSDLAGGSPFKISAELIVTNNYKAKLIAGTNIAMLLEASLARNFNDLETLASNLIDSGKESVMLLDLAALNKPKNDDDDENEGI